MQRLFALSAALLFLATTGIWLAGEAVAQTKSKPQAQSREALYLKCRNEVFRKYGQPGEQYGAPKGYLALPYTSDSMIDQCIANGGPGQPR
jgi:hypothetical protein